MKRLYLLGLVALAGCSPQEPAPAPPRPVLTAPVVALDTERFGRFAGNIEARYQSNIGFRISGRIARRLVDVGDEVKQGQLLAVLDPTDQQNRLRASQGDLARMQAQWINAEADARRQQALFDHGVGAQAQLDMAVANLKTATASLDQAKAARSQARDQVDYGDLRADHDAVVNEWRAEAGQVVSAGQVVVVLARPDVKEAVIDLPAALVERLPPGTLFQVEAQLAPQVVSAATLREIEPQADSSTRTRRARLSLAQTPPGFRLGTPIRVSLSSAIAPRLQVPLLALQEQNGKVQVWRVDAASKTVVPQPVQVLERADGAAIVQGGLNAGDRVVTAGLNSLQPGQTVKLDEGNAR
ncbi:efflux RND transporter periplasmic adaptor subunit [Pseudomonas typographi]|uniref:Efflux RND transporter periplasmic adaptor subunit n=1 Tax=Pseudomonas typographi TaxID=2715964 RepID=A0ABR7YZ64_9PSED|nr:efflux RND transporter periplasmic adaptor subunit [Pseudomonas typographi]MBD1585398.1 efflux RND transporter periplasmic adaptor subunit [Pseudomonas typographi]MBD1598488.1 efflux RND transporter periplasmic adaptor subunit [Pseudomonas typographi]